MNQYRHLSAFPENKEVLAALKGKGVVTGILSNGDPRCSAWPFAAPDSKACSTTC